MSKNVVTKFKEILASELVVDDVVLELQERGALDEYGGQIYKAVTIADTLVITDITKVGKFVVAAVKKSSGDTTISLNPEDKVVVLYSEEISPLQPKTREPEPKSLGEILEEPADGQTEEKEEIIPDVIEPKKVGRPKKKVILG